MNCGVPPRKLYKYRSFNVHSLRMITEGEIYYSDPRKFNDPLDCNPTIKIDLDCKDLERLLYRLESDKEGRDSALGKIGHLRYMSTEYGDYKKDKEANKYYQMSLAEDIRTHIDNEFKTQGILSLSSTWCSALMWSHYADEHRGLCIEYDTAEAERPSLGSVGYNLPRSIKTSEIFNWKIRGCDRSKNSIQRTYLFAKSPQWKYEMEWRDISDVAKLSESAFPITAIYFGLRCDISVVHAIVKLLSDSLNIRLYEMRPMDTSFRLSRCLVEREEIESRGIPIPADRLFKDIVFPIDETPENAPDGSESNGSDIFDTSPGSVHEQ